jgi:hypothetical protein
VKEKENDERRSLNEIVWSIKKKKKNRNAGRFENDKSEQKTTGTFDEKKKPSSYTSREKERSQSKKK